MIPPQTVAKILDAAQIEEVVGDFVSLKKRGANYVANCPFHNEKTPSFSVSPAKGIYKCFGCGNAGNSAKFVMEHENISYPEALRFLAKRYNIEVEEIDTQEAREEKEERDSLFIVNEFASQYYQNNLFESDEGKSIGLSYFKQRGFRTETIKKFQLGYSLEQYDALFKEATAKGYKVEYLQKLGLARNKNGRDYDFFRARVQFPIFNLSGKVIAFAGRTLKSDKKIPKYVNSPETEIYHKSFTLYGMYFAKRAIRQRDECFLVEGYTDVISLHQAGIENVVASSGTSLTEEQIRLVKRYTPNVTMLYDGDAAGLKAAIRGVDMVLEQGLNVKVVVLPDGEDPDSFVQKQGRTGFEEYIAENAKDFIFFKTTLLLEDAKGDPVKKTALIRDIIQTLAKIPDPIKRSLYVKECSSLLDMSEQIIINETNKLKWSQLKKQHEQTSDEQRIEIGEIPRTLEEDTTTKEDKRYRFIHQERELVRVLLEFGKNELELEVPVGAYIISEIEELQLDFPAYQQIINLYKLHLEEGKLLDSDFFIAHEDDTISKTAVMLIHAYELSENWEKKHNIFITPKTLRFKNDVYSSLNAFKMSQVKRLMDECLEGLQNAKDPEEIKECQETFMTLMEWQKELAIERKSVIVR
ncbi:MAG: DNA primase [Chitinophagales bacterium]